MSTFTFATLSVFQGFLTYFTSPVFVFLAVSDLAALMNSSYSRRTHSDVSCQIFPTYWSSGRKQNSKWSWCCSVTAGRLRSDYYLLTTLSGVIEERRRLQWILFHKTFSWWCTKRDSWCIDPVWIVSLITQLIRLKTRHHKDVTANSVVSDVVCWYTGAADRTEPEPEPALLSQTCSRQHEQIYFWAQLVPCWCWWDDVVHWAFNTKLHEVWTLITANRDLTDVTNIICVIDDTIKQDQ